jgi:hypothetical protein
MFGLLKLAFIRQYPSVILGFRCGVDEICALLGGYAVYNDNTLPTFWNNLSVPSSQANKSQNCWISLPLKMGPILGFLDP